ncbi:MAG: heterodisulfide reductase-related iron-sulfur binding cluster [Anaerovoracaceae bacterium]
MDMETCYKQFENCLQEENPYCTDDCPFQMNVIDFKEKMRSKRYNAAYKVLRNAVAFPDIVAALCPEYCGASCPRASMDKPVQVNLLEKTCVAKTKRKEPNEYNLPTKKGKVAIIGAGLSGLACGLRVASKKYEVVIYEKTDRIGGQLWELLPEKLFMEDIERQFKFENYTLNLKTEIKNIKELQNEGFDAVYVATGKGGLDFGILDQEDGHCTLYGETAAFAGGSLVGKDVINAIADGINMAWSVEVFLKTGKVQYIKEKEPTRVVVNTSSMTKCEPVIPTDGGIFTEEEIEEEASRCIDCQCDGCRNYCDLTAYYDKWPKQMRDDIMTTTMSADSIVHKTPAIKLINACTQCNLCDEGCPGGIKLGQMIKEARRKLHKLDRMPGAYHQFWVQDMQFANGKYASLTKTGRETESCDYAFFPGCHLGAANPQYVMRSYEWLLSKKSDTGIILRCCGVPADWAGNEQLHQEEIEALCNDWESLGKPTLIMACTSCMRHFREYMPQIPMISLYEIMVKWDIAAEVKFQAEDETYAIFDPCASRNEKPVQDSIRELTGNMGISIEELPNEARYGCCGFGGNVEVANPKFAGRIAKERSNLSENPYITYCINCKDVFMDEGKPVKHILDVIFDIESKDGNLPTVTQRRNNRVALKETLLKEMWGEEMENVPKLKYKLIISPEIQGKMNKLKILEEDICKVLEIGEDAGRRTLNSETNTYKCYRELGYITCWVEYRLIDCKYQIVNLYTHRMKIELEAMWNGKKTDTDLR